MEDLRLSFVRKMEESRGRKRRVERRPVRGVNVAQRPAAGGGHDDLQGGRGHTQVRAGLGSATHTPKTTAKGQAAALQNQSGRVDTRLKQEKARNTPSEANEA